MRRGGLVSEGDGGEIVFRHELGPGVTI
jgi:hypothetical protein